MFNARKEFEWSKSVTLRAGVGSEGMERWGGKGPVFQFHWTLLVPVSGGGLCSGGTSVAPWDWSEMETKRRKERFSLGLGRLCSASGGTLEGNRCM